MIKNDYPFSDPEYGLWLLLSHTRMAISKARQMKIGKYIHHNQASALVTVWSENGQATPGSISRALFLQHHTVSELLTRLEHKGFISKHRDEQTRTVVRLRITGKGKAYCIEATQKELIKKIISALTTEEQEQFKELLQKLVDAAEFEIRTEQ